MQTKPAAAVAELLEHAIDYAGLYPPASLTLLEAAREYAQQRRGPNAWALGRFVVSLDRVAALVETPDVFDSHPWPLSVLCTEAAPDLTTVDRNKELVRLEAIEVKANTVSEVRAFAPLGSRVPELYVELPSTAATGDLLSEVRALGAYAKIRTGGVTPDAIPSAAAVARFLRACALVGVRFKVTAGLHHALRGEYALTYDAGSARATMFGFLNVFLAAAFARRGHSEEILMRVLEEREPGALRLASSGSSICWRDECLTLDDIRAARSAGISAFGSCSFAEPLAELAALNLSTAA